MRSRLFLVLVVVAVSVWLLAIYRLGLFDGAGRSTVDHALGKGDTEIVVTYSGGAVRDVFRSKLSSPAKRVVGRNTGIQKQTVPSPATDAAQNAPLFQPKLKGMLAADPPIAILDSFGRTELVKPKGMAFGWMVLNVSDSGVVISKGANRVLLPR